MKREFMTDVFDLPPVCDSGKTLTEFENVWKEIIVITFQRCPYRALLQSLHTWFSGSYGATDDDDEDSGDSGAARSYQSIKLVGGLSFGLVAAMAMAIITVLYHIF